MDFFPFVLKIFLNLNILRLCSKLKPRPPTSQARVLSIKPSCLLRVEGVKVYVQQFTSNLQYAVNSSNQGKLSVTN